MQPLSVHDDFPRLDGPDYVTLVIEWDDDAAVTTVSAIAPEPTPPANRTIVTVLGALAALVLATWGLRRLAA